MKLSYIIVALATIAVAYAGSVTITPSGPKNATIMKLVKKVAESGLGKCFSPCSSNSDCQDPQCDSCVLSPAGGNVCGIAPKVAASPHGPPIAVPCRWPLVLHSSACKQSNNKDSCEKEDPVFGWAEAGVCNDPGLDDGGWPVCCVVQTGQQFWYRKGLSCEYNKWQKCPETAPPTSPSTTSEAVTTALTRDELVAPLSASPKNAGDFHQLVATWEEGVKVTEGSCAKQGHCGIAYAGCCVAAGIKGKACVCNLVDGDGAVGSGCTTLPSYGGTCGVAYMACCAAYKHKGFPCTCNVEPK